MEESEPERAPGLPTCFVPVLYDGTRNGFVGVGLVRDLGIRGAGVDPGPSVWVLEQAFADDARDLHCWMLTRPERWSVWARIAPIVGAEMLALMMEDERDRDVRRSAELEDENAAFRRRTRTVTAESTILLGRSCVTLRRGVEEDPFLVLAFDETVERDRLWDWLRWQPHRFREWRLFWELEGTVALRKMIRGSMIIDEKRARAAGLAIRGRRPLRLWRGGRNSRIIDG